MSYSFGVKAPTKSEAKQKVAAEFDRIVASQPIHAADRAQAEAAASAFIDVLPDDESRDLSVSVNGSVGWSGEMVANNLYNASVNVYAALVTRS